MAGVYKGVGLMNEGKPRIKTAIAIMFVIFSLFIVWVNPKKTVAPTDPQAFVGSVDLDVYHYRECRAAKRIPGADMVWFSSVAEAKTYGYRACKLCNTPLK